MKEGSKEIQDELDKVEDKAKKRDIKVGWSEEERKKAEENINRILEKKKQLAKEETISVAAPDVSREADFDWEKNARESARINAELEKAVSAAGGLSDGAEEADVHFNALRADVEEYAKTLLELESQGKYFGDADYDEVYLAWRNAKDAVKQYAAELDKQTESGRAQEAAIAAKEAAREEKVKAQEAAERELQEIRQSAVVSNQNLVYLLQEQERITQRMALLKKAGVADGYEEYDSLKEQLALVNEEIENTREGFNQVKKSGEKAFSVIQNGSKKTSGLLGTLSSRLKGIALSMLVFNWITKGFNAMVSAMKEGFQNLAQYSSDYNKSMSELKSSTAQLKNGLAAAFEPIANMVIPYLTQLVGWLNTAVDAMSRFLAVLQGKSTYTRAKEQVIDYAKSLNTAADAAQGALASFDQLNVLNQKDVGGAGNGGESTGADAFETVTIAESDLAMLDLVKEKLNGILDILLPIGIAMAVFGVGGPLGTFVGVLMTVLGLLKFILEYMDAWSNGISFDNLTGMLEGLLATIIGIYILFGPIAAGVAMIVGGIAMVVLAIKDMIDNGVNAQNSITLAIGAVTALVGIFLVFGATVGVIVGAVAAVITIFGVLIAIAGNGEEALASLKSMCKNFADFFKKLFTGDIIGAMDSLNMAAKDLLNVFIISIESLVNCIIKALNWLIDKINSISFDVPDWVPIIGGETLSPNISKITEVSIPRLADGAVIQGGRPFAAILGDQRFGQTNIETPLPTMVAAFKQALAESGGSGGEYTFVAQLDSKTIFKETVKQNRMYKKTTGYSAF